MAPLRGSAIGSPGSLLFGVCRFGTDLRCCSMGMQRWFTGLLMAAILVLLLGAFLFLVTFGSPVRDWCARTWVDAFLLSARP